MRLPPSAPPIPEATLTPNPGPREVPAAAAALPPALPEIIEPPFWQAPSPAMEILVNTPRPAVIRVRGLPTPLSWDLLPKPQI